MTSTVIVVAIQILYAPDFGTDTGATGDHRSAHPTTLVFGETGEVELERGIRGVFVDTAEGQRQVLCVDVCVPTRGRVHRHLSGETAEGSEAGRVSMLVFYSST